MFPRHCWLRAKPTSRTDTSRQRRILSHGCSLAPTTSSSSRKLSAGVWKGIVGFQTPALSLRELLEVVGANEQQAQRWSLEGDRRFPHDYRFAECRLLLMTTD